ncbi:MAG: orotidine-5'-phosphate decarboxylase [Firmicutes bacterium]|nr:orotidine-5'-phosphate decarboxylase [Bacillota bacterium]
MNNNAMDRLIQRIRETDNPTVMGLDPKYEMVPEFIRAKYNADMEGACRAILEFNKGLIDSVTGIVPAVKPQAAYYEALGPSGMMVFKETCDYAKQKNMIVIADIKRGDIGPTAVAYSSAYLGKTKIGEAEHSIFDVDFVTLNGYLGTDSIQPFIEDCKAYGKGAFILAKTSNPSSGELQDLKLETGQTVYEKVAELAKGWGKDLIGENGYSSIGIVVGATYPAQIEELRRLVQSTYFLIPGYGAQGGKAEDIALAFRNGLGGIVNASRSLMTAYTKVEGLPAEQYQQATRAEAVRMRDELNNAINE